MKFDEILKKNRNYFIFAVILILFHVAIGFVISKSPNFTYSETFIYVAKTVLILFVLISIPATLKIYSNKLKKITTLDNNSIKAKEYTKAFRFRLIPIITGLISAIMFYFVLKIEDMIYVILIEIVISLFCLPTKNKTKQELIDIKLIKEEDKPC